MSMRENDRARPQGSKRVTISTLADHLGLTKGTISRALSDYPDISELTRARVRKAADQLGYRPLGNAQAIRTGRVRALGLVLQVNEHDGHRPFVAEFLAGVSAAASAAGWTLTVATASSDEDTLSTLLTLSQDQKADGFILPRTRLRDPRVETLRKEGIPFILYGRTEDPEGCAWFDIESETAMSDAVMRLAALGHQRIGFVAGAKGYTYADLRLKGYRDGLAAAGLAFDPDLIVGPALNRPDGATAARDLLSLDPPPTAILYAVDRACLGAYQVAAEMGLTVGEDLSLVSYDGIPEGELMEPPLSTYKVDTRGAGQRLAEMLMDLIRGQQATDLRELARAEFLETGSIGPAPNATNHKSN